MSGSCARWIGIPLLGIVLFGMAGLARGSTIYTFDVTGIVDHGVIDQSYGDHVNGPTDGAGTYGTTDGTYTPNVAVSYGATGEIPALWTTGYGNLTNVLFNDQDGSATFTINFTADPGFEVILESFDMASFTGGGQTLPDVAIQLVDATNMVLWSVAGPFAVPGSGSHVTLMPNQAASSLTLLVNLSGLGSVSDNIGLDNITISQAAAAVPEPGTGVLVGLGLTLLAVHHGRRPRRWAMPVRSN